MAKKTTQFICSECGTIYPRWAGKCEACNSWNTITEELKTDAAPGPAAKAPKGHAASLIPLDGDADIPERISTHMPEFDRVAGGGLVAGSALLVGGNPGIGKSTLLIQIAAALANQKRGVIYVSGEEAIDQVRLRADRLGLGKAAVSLCASTCVEDILATVDDSEATELLIVDSVQTVWTRGIESTPGTVSQVRHATHSLINYAKKKNIILVLIGHVTKDGQIAGPRVVEHMVDAVLYFEGDHTHHFRILRTVKNRFGATDEIGVFEMTSQGLKEVANPSELFLGERSGEVAGAAVFAAIEGTRPLLIEFQALVAPSTLGTPRRAVVGWDQGRLAMILAVLDAHCGMKFSQHDVYLNVAGGLRVNEPAADLAVAAALISSLSGNPLPSNRVYFGEISLSGRLRPIGQTAMRLKEAEKLGFKSAFIPEKAFEEANKSSKMKLAGLEDLGNLVAHIAQENM